MITLGGKNGAGKGTVTKKLAEELGYEIISIGNIKRKLAAEMGLTILEFDKIGRENPEKAKEFDLKYEDYQKSLDPTEPVILDSRLSFMCQPDAFKVFLEVSDEEGARRIFEHQREDDENESYEAVYQANLERHQGQYHAYMKLYQIDIFDIGNYDLVIDTTDLTPDEVYTEILENYLMRKNNK